MEGATAPSRDNGNSNHDSQESNVQRNEVKIRLLSPTHRRNVKLLNRQDSCHSQELSPPSRRLPLNVLVRKATHVGGGRGRHCDGPKIPAYRMTSLPRGKALILEIASFQNDVHEFRAGSNVDVDNLTKLLTQLHFQVTHKKDLGYRQFNQALSEFANDEAHSRSDMAVIAVLSHGCDGHVVTSDGRRIYTEDIYAKFNNRSCPKLRGKPKFFIMQACRGDQRDKSYLSVSNPNNLPIASTINLGNSDRRKRARGDSSSSAAPDVGASDNQCAEDLDRARPTWEDIIIAYSSIPGYESLRDHDTGSWFIRSLVEVFMNHSCEMDLMDLLLVTSEVLSRRCLEEEDAQRDAQTCNVELRHIYKRIFLNPGLPNDGNPSGNVINDTCSDNSSSPPSLLNSPNRGSSPISTRLNTANTKLQ